MSELPPGWATASIGRVTMPFEGIDPSRSPDTWVDYIDIGSIDNATQRIADTKRFLGRDAPSRARRLVKTGDILFSTVRTYLKNIARVPEELDGALTSTGIAVLRPSEALEGSYLFRWVCSAPFLEAISKAQDGTMYPAVSDRDVAAAAISIPPLAEQRRIVARLDALTNRTARARADLDRIPALAARYKQAVLAKAFSGELTAGWRMANAVDLATWRLTPVGNLARDVRYGTAAKCNFSPSETPVLRIPNIAQGRIDTSDLKHATFDDKERGKLALELGDVLVIRSNGSVRLVGRAAVVTADVVGFLYAGYLIRLRLDQEQVNPEYLQRALEAPSIRAKIESSAKSTSGVNNINSEQLKGLSLPLPILAEQAEVVRRIDRAFADMDRLTIEAAAARQLLDRLDQAFLAKAFRGELVPQNPADEPARALLDRIRAERAAAPKPKHRLSPRTPATRKKTDMPKSRLDDDVKHQPFLASILKASGTALSADSLFKSADLPIADFYKQLAWEIDNGLVAERGETLEAG